VTFIGWRGPIYDVARAICFGLLNSQPIWIRKGESHMPKIKTNRSAAKRFKKTGTGKVVYHKSFASHILSTKSRKRKRSLRKNPLIHKSNMRAVKLLLPNG
jgi:large subunit ribosomal protein L35